MTKNLNKTKKITKKKLQTSWSCQVIFSNKTGKYQNFCELFVFITKLEYTFNLISYF